jgi:hemolysin D
MIAMIRHELLGGKTPKSVSERTGFASAGQDAEIKVDAFNFNRYGLIEGKVVSISSDAIIRDKPPDKNNANQRDTAREETSEPANQELSYAARVSLARTRMEIEDKAVDTSPA